MKFLLRCFPYIFPLSFFLLTLVATVVAYKSLQEMRHSESRRWQQVPVPDERPEMSQASIDWALKRFQIQIPPGVKAPVIDFALTERGVTVIAGLSTVKSVRIGPSAFQSWAILASTLAHELEVHCQQNFAWVRLLDLIGLDGTSQAERQAYHYELAHAQRFGLSLHEKHAIEDTMHFYYAEPRPAEAQEGWRKWWGALGLDF